METKHERLGARKLSLSPPEFSFSLENTEENSNTQLENVEEKNENHSEPNEKNGLSFPDLNSQTQESSNNSNEGTTNKSPRDEESDKARSKKRKSVFSWVSKNIEKHSHFTGKMKPTDSITSTSSTEKIKLPPKLDFPKPEETAVEFEKVELKIDLSKADIVNGRTEDSLRAPRLHKRSKSEIMEKIHIVSKSNQNNNTETRRSVREGTSDDKEDTNNDQNGEEGDKISAPKITISTQNEEIPRKNFSQTLPEGWNISQISNEPKKENDPLNKEPISPNQLTPNSSKQNSSTNTEVNPTNEVLSTPENIPPLTPNTSPITPAPSPITENKPSISPDIKTKTNESKRREVLQELIQTEVQYIENLDVILNVFLEPLRQGNILDKVQLSSVFSNVEAIYPVNVDLLNDLRTLQSKLESSDETPPTLNIGKIFSDKADLFKLYAVYCSNQPNIHDRLEDLQDDSEELCTFMKKCFRRPECRKLDIESFLISPLQRLCKYPLLLKELLKSTSEDHPEYADIKEGKEKIEVIVNKVNERVRQVENVNKLISVNKEIEFNSFQFDILSDQKRVLVLQDDIKINGKGFYGYLFSDGLLLCSVTPTHKEAKKFISAKLALATDLDDIPPDLLYRFELAEVGGRIMEIECTNRLSKKRWLTNFQKVIDSAGGTSKKDKERAIRALRRASLEPPLHPVPKQKAPILSSKLREESVSQRLSLRHTFREAIGDKDKDKDKETPKLDRGSYTERSSLLNSLFGKSATSVKKTTSETNEKKNDQLAPKIEKPKKNSAPNVNYTVESKRISMLESELEDLTQIYNVLKTLLKEERDMNDEYLKRIQSLEETVATLSSLNAFQTMQRDGRSRKLFIGERAKSDPNTDIANSIISKNENMEQTDQKQEQNSVENLNNENNNNNNKNNNNDKETINNEVTIEEIKIQINDKDITESDFVGKDKDSDPSTTDHSASDIGDFTPRSILEDTPRGGVDVLNERLHFLNEVVEKMTEENVRLRTKLHQAKQKLKEYDISLNLSTDENTQS